MAAMYGWRQNCPGCGFGGLRKIISILEHTHGSDFRVLMWVVEMKKSQIREKEGKLVRNMYSFNQF